MALKICKVEPDGNAEYATAREFVEGHAHVAILVDDIDGDQPDAILVEYNRDAGTVTFAATHGIWPDDPDGEKLVVYWVDFTGWTDESFEHLAKLASFAALDRHAEYDRTRWSPELIEAYEDALPCYE